MQFISCYNKGFARACYMSAVDRLGLCPGPHSSTHADRMSTIMNISGCHGRKKATTLKTVTLTIKYSDLKVTHSISSQVLWAKTSHTAVPNTEGPRSTILPSTQQDFLVKILGGHHHWLSQWVSVCVCIWERQRQRQSETDTENGDSRVKCR